MAGLFPSLSPRALCRRLAVAVLGAGLLAALFAHLRAGPGEAPLLGYDGLGGAAYPVRPQDSKTYLRSMEMYGGKANLLAEEFREWFASLWQGGRLALTLAGISLVLALFLYYVSTRFPPDAPSTDKG